MSRFSIACKINNGEIKCDPEIEHIVGFASEDITIEVLCDVGCGDSELSESDVAGNNSFTMTYKGDEGITVERNRCFLNVHLDENKTPFTREYAIVCSHSDDSLTAIVINITQEAKTFSITASETPPNVNTGSTEESEIIITLPSIINNGEQEGNNLQYIEKPIYISVIGGSEKYRVVGISKWGYIENEDTQEEYAPMIMQYDDGLILIQEQDKIRIKNYGRPFSEANAFYEIKLQHYDVRDLVFSIKVFYTPISDREDSPSNVMTNNANGNESSDLQNSDIYKPWDIRKPKSKPSLPGIIRTYSINFEQDEYNINGMGLTEIPFNVKEIINGREQEIDSFLATASIASAYWCDTTVIEEFDENNAINRKLVVNIKNRPIGERKTEVKIYILDKPSIIKNIIIVNMPL